MYSYVRIIFIQFMPLTFILQHMNFVIISKSMKSSVYFLVQNNSNAILNLLFMSVIIFIFLSSTISITLTHLSHIYYFLNYLYSFILLAHLFNLISLLLTTFIYLISLSYFSNSLLSIYFKTTPLCIFM